MNGINICSNILHILKIIQMLLYCIYSSVICDLNIAFKIYLCLCGQQNRANPIGGGVGEPAVSKL